MKSDTQNKDFVNNHSEITSDKTFAKFGISFIRMDFLPEDVIQKIFNATERMFKEIPALNGVLTDYVVERLDRGTIASTRPVFSDDKVTFSISFNSLFWTDFQIISDELKDSFSTKFLAIDSIEGALYHEIGHVVNGLIILKKTTSKVDFLHDWSRNLTISDVIRKYKITEKEIEGISSYATYDSGEAYAEIFASYYSRNALSSKMTQMIKSTVVLRD